MSLRDIMVESNWTERSHGCSMFGSMSKKNGTPD